MAYAIVSISFPVSKYQASQGISALLTYAITPVFPSGPCESIAPRPSGPSSTVRSVGWEALKYPSVLLSERRSFNLLNAS